MTDLHVGTTASGVPVVHRSRPGDAQIALVFGSGQGSASTASAGLPHLVEHVVMRGVGVPAGEHNAVAERDAMTFFAGGSAAPAAWFRGSSDRIDSTSGGGRGH